MFNLAYKFLRQETDLKFSTIEGSQNRKPSKAYETF